jgi:fatty-acyl-CoA synthase
MLPTGRGYFASFLGAMLAGGVPVPLYPPFRLDRIAEYIAREAKILENAGTEILLTFDRAARVADMIRDQVAVLKHVASVDAILAEPAPPSWITAEVEPRRHRPPAVHLRQHRRPQGRRADPGQRARQHPRRRGRLRADRRDVMVSWLPLYHDMGLIGGWLMSFYFGNPTVLMSPVSFLSRPERWLQALSHTTAAPSRSRPTSPSTCASAASPPSSSPASTSRARAPCSTAPSRSCPPPSTASPPTSRPPACAPRPCSAPTASPRTWSP